MDEPVDPALSTAPLLLIAVAAVLVLLFLIIRIKLHGDPSIGFVELWMNTGSGWIKQSLHGRSRLYMRTYDSSNNGGTNNSRMGLYYRRDIPGPLTMFHGPLRIASASSTAFAAVAPTSYR